VSALQSEGISPCEARGTQLLNKLEYKKTKIKRKKLENKNKTKGGKLLI
jgi:hypothetical protein